MVRPLTDLPPYIYGTTRLGHADVPREQQLAMARAAIGAGLWLHTSRQYDHALEVLGEVFAEDRSAIPPLIVKLGGGTAARIRATIEENLRPLQISAIGIGQLSPVDELATDLVQGGPILAELGRIKTEGLVGRFVLEIFPWTSTAPLQALRKGHLDGLIDGFICYLNPLQRFASNELWDELLARDEAVISMRTVCGAPVHALRDVPGAAWQPYLQQRAAEVAPIFEQSGIASWVEFCMRFAHSTPQVVSTVGSTSKRENLQELIKHSRTIEPLPRDILDQVNALQRRWSDEVDLHAEPWSM
jgi:aryl-alcohol dehydrogenase-like predicted oxidoreductase